MSFVSLGVHYISSLQCSEVLSIKNSSTEHPITHFLQHRTNSNIKQSLSNSKLLSIFSIEYLRADKPVLCLLRLLVVRSAMFEEFSSNSLRSGHYMYNGGTVLWLGNRERPSKPCYPLLRCSGLLEFNSSYQMQTYHFPHSPSHYCTRFWSYRLWSFYPILLHSTLFYSVSVEFHFAVVETTFD